MTELTCFQCKSQDVKQNELGAFICQNCGQKFYIFETDPSTLNELQSCALKFNFTSIKQLERIEGKGAGIERGTIVHEAFRAYYHLALHNVDWETRKKKALNYGEMKAAESNLEVDDINNVMKSIGDYFDFYHGDSWIPKEVEVAFKKLIYEDAELKLVLSGKIDLIADTGPRNNNILMPVDHKSGIDVAPCELSNQFMAYSYVKQSSLFCVNKVGFQKTVPNEKKFKRHIIPYSQQLLNHWLKNTIWWVKYALYCMENESFPQNFTSCDKYSGCQYKDVCYADPNNMEYKLRSLFKVREKPWDPATIDVSPDELSQILEKM